MLYIRQRLKRTFFAAFTKKKKNVCSEVLCTIAIESVFCRRTAVNMRVVPKMCCCHDSR